DVQRVVAGIKPVTFFGRTGGVVPTPDEVKNEIVRLVRQKTKAPSKRKTPAKKTTRQTRGKKA
ncbi:MAG: hypothetical protein D6800_11375, partial [Candidatus Zixiibacteriota bacterium]